MANIELNKCKNVVANQLALQDNAQITNLKMNYTPTVAGAASFGKLDEFDNVEEINVIVSTLDAYCDKNNVYPNFIKCDVEGSELFVFKGGENTLRKHRPIVFVEILRKFCAKFGHSAMDVVDFMHSCGYTMHIIRDTNLQPIKQITDETVDTNFVFI